MQVWVLLELNVGALHLRRVKYREHQVETRDFLTLLATPSVNDSPLTAE